jgi:hypothetical protein
MEDRLEWIKNEIQHTEEGKEAAFILIKQTMPCIMHNGNRWGKDYNDVTFDSCHGI